MRFDWFSLTLLEGICIDDITMNTSLLFYFMKQIDSRLSWICTVINRRRCKKCGENISDMLLCAMHVWHIFVLITF